MDQPSRKTAVDGPFTGCLARAVLARAAASTRRPRERLGNRQPLRGNLPFGADRRVRSMPALRDEQAEVERGPGHAVRRVTGTPCPHLAVGSREFDPDGFGGYLEPVHREAVWQRPDAYVRDVPKSAGRLADLSEGVGDVLAVCPGLHYPRGQRGRRTHRRAEPRQPEGGVELGEDLDQPAARGIEPGKQLAAGQ